jgi:hypothetical protein
MDPSPEHLKSCGCSKQVYTRQVLLLQLNDKSEMDWYLYLC